MATTLLQEFGRARDATFLQLTETAVWRVWPDIVGEPLGVSAWTSGVSLTQPMIDKRHSWAMDFARQPDFWIPRIARALAGENQIRNVEIAAGQPSEAIMIGRFQAIVNDLAGVKIGD